MSNFGKQTKGPDNANLQVKFFKVKKFKKNIWTLSKLFNKTATHPEFKCFKNHLNKQKNKDNVSESNRLFKKVLKPQKFRAKKIRWKCGHILYYWNFSGNSDVYSLTEDWWMNGIWTQLHHTIWLAMIDCSSVTNRIKLFFTGAMELMWHSLLKSKETSCYKSKVLRKDWEQKVSVTSHRWE